MNCKLLVTLTSIACLACFQTGCSKPDAAETTSARPSEIKHPLKGEIVDVKTDQAFLIVKHDEIPGYMQAMTMRFRVTPETIQTVAKGDRIAATLIQRESGFYLESVTVVEKAAPTSAPQTPPTGSAAAVSPSTPPAAASSERLDKGKSVFLRTCAACHQANGAGIKGVFPPIDPTIVSGDPVRLIKIVLHGLQGPITVGGVTYNSMMPPQAAMLPDNDIADVLTYVRHTWGGPAAPVEAKDVAQERAKGPRTTMWTWAELNPQ
ncbi:MAG TPA: copper-binding protein [Opitutaceae bacterium]|nr:copper-binding protein [Opitutaceae bacterium]